MKDCCWQMSWDLRGNWNRKAVCCSQNLLTRKSCWWNHLQESRGCWRQCHIQRHPRPFLARWYACERLRLYNLFWYSGRWTSCVHVWYGDGLQVRPANQECSRGRLGSFNKRCIFNLSNNRRNKANRYRPLRTARSKTARTQPTWQILHQRQGRIRTLLPPPNAIPSTYTPITSPHSFSQIVGPKRWPSW